MDAFGDDFTATSDVDPAAEFLAREHDQLAGLEDLIPEVSQSQPAEIVQGILYITVSNSKFECVTKL